MFSHVTWAGAQTMYRIYKSYDMRLHTLDGQLIPGHKVAMSSYPGRFTSGDDFYITSTRLAIQETTIAIWDESLNKNIKPQSVLQWARSALAYRMAVYISSMLVYDSIELHKTGYTGIHYIIVVYIIINGWYLIIRSLHLISLFNLVLSGSLNKFLVVVMLVI